MQFGFLLFSRPSPRCRRSTEPGARFALGLLLAMVLLGPSSALAQGSTNSNLLSDSGFESGELRAPFTVLGQVQATVDGTVSLAGGYSLKTTAGLVFSARQPNSERAVAPLRGAETVHLSGWLLGNAAAVPANAQIYCLDRNYRSQDLPSASVELVATSQWQFFTLQHTCPDKSRFVGLDLGVQGQGNTVWWDQMALRPELPVGSSSLGWDFEEDQLPAQLSLATGATIELDDQRALTGGQSLKMSSSSSDGFSRPWRLSSKAVLTELEGGETLALSGWALADALDVPIELRILCLDASFQHLDGGMPADFDASVLWQPVELIRTCPTGSRYASIRLDVDAKDRTVWWDNLRFAVAHSGQQLGAELLPNPGFEDPLLPANFQQANFGELALDSTVAHSGQRSLRHRATEADSNTRPWQGNRRAALVAIENDSPFAFEAWARADLDLTAAEVLLACLDEQYRRGTLPYAVRNLLAGPDWKPMRVELSCPQEARFVSVRLSVKTAGRTVWWDDLSLVPKPVELPFELREAGNTGRSLIPGEALDFGATEVGRTIERRLELTNTSSQNISLTQGSITVDGSEFSVTHQAIPSLAPGQSMTVLLEANGGGALGHIERSLTIRPTGQEGELQLRLRRSIPRHPTMAVLFRGEELSYGQIVDLGEAPAGSLRDDQFEVVNRSSAMLSFPEGAIETDMATFDVMAEQPFQVAGAASGSFMLRSLAPPAVGMDLVGQLRLGATEDSFGSFEVLPYLHTVDWMIEPMSSESLAGQTCQEAVQDGVHWAHPTITDPNNPDRRVLLIEFPGYSLSSTSSQTRVSVRGRGRFNAALPTCPGGQGSEGCDPLQLEVGCFWNDSINSPGSALYDKSSPDHFVLGGSGGPVYGPAQSWPCLETPPTELIPRCDENGEPVKYLGWVVVAYRSLSPGFWTFFGVIGPNNDVCVQRTLMEGTTECGDQTRLVGRIEGLSAAVEANLVVTQRETGNPNALRDSFPVNAQTAPPFSFEVQSEVASGWTWNVEVQSLNWVTQGQTAGSPPFRCPNTDYDPATGLGIENRTGTGGGQAEAEIVIHCECTRPPQQLEGVLRGEMPVDECEEEPPGPNEYHVWFDVDYFQDTQGEFTAQLNGGAQEIRNIGGPGIFRFPEPLPDGSQYEVSVTNVGFLMECHVGSASDWATTGRATGTVDGRDSYEVSIYCFDPLPEPCELLPEICDQISDCEYETFIFEPEADITTITGETGGEFGSGSVDIFRGWSRCPDPYDLSGSPIVTLGAGLYLRNVAGEVATSSTYTLQGVARDDLHGVNEVRIFIGGQPAQHGGTLSINQYDPWTCSEQPSSACNNYSAFSAQIDTTQLSPGEHELVIAAFNGEDVPTVLQSTLVVGGQGGSGTAPSPPVVVTAQGSTGHIHITWSASTGASEYLLYRDDDTTPGNSTLIPGVFGPGNRSYTDTQITPGQSYCYWVKARNSQGTSNYGPTSPQASNCAVAEDNGGGGSSGPNPPANVFASLDQPDRIAVSWTASVDTEEYLLFRAAGQHLSQASLLPVSFGAGDLSYDDTDPSLVIGQTYCYWVQARNAQGTSEHGPSNNIGTHCGVIPGGGGSPPDPPASVNASSDLTDRIRVTWSASADTDRYLVYRDSDSTSAGSQLVLTTANGSVLSYEDLDNSLVTGQTYCYWVRAENDHGQSALAPIGSTTTHCGQMAEDSGGGGGGGGGGSAPPPPANVFASLDQSDRITVSWSPAAGAERYLLYRDDDQTSAGAVLIRTNHGYNNRIHHDSDPNLVPGQTYCYWVKAQNSHGTSEFGPTSNVATRCGQRVPTGGAELTLRRTGGAVVPYNGTIHFNTMQGIDRSVDLEIENNGNVALHLSGLSLPGEYFSPNGLPASIPAGQSATFRVTLSGSVPGTFDIVMTFNHDAIDQPTPFRVQLNGEVVPDIMLP